MKPEAKQFSTTVGGRVITFETGKLAGQANGAVTVQLGETMIFAAATMSKTARADVDFFPLSVEYEERMYAGGRIPGSFFRREGKPSTEAVLTARLADRPIRPLFPKGMRNEVQIIMYSLSVDNENPIDILAINAASATLMISDIPWNGPVGAVRVGLLDGEFVINPTFQELERSDLDLRIAGTREAILMVECGAKEVPEDVMVAALEFGHRALQPLIDLQEQMRAEVGKPKAEPILILPDEALLESVFERVKEPMNELLDKPLSKEEFNSGMDALLAQITAEMTSGENPPSPQDIQLAFTEAEKRLVRARILEGKRPDGRGPKDIRPIWCEVDVAPRAHGSGLFTRGETQVLTLATLGTLSEAQEIDSLIPQETKRYMHHYNFPPFSTGEVKPLRGQSRREIGHGALAERALEPVIPPESEFPYTLRLVSEVLSSNGSTSMASVCGSTLALMDTGVPIKAPVAGVAMGLIKEGERYVILTDIQGAEDHLGDMDFKVAGTTKGITALQMDIKIGGLTKEIMAEALEQARQARLAILEKMLEVIPAPRADLKPHAPRITTVLIPTDKIGALIGPGGKTVRAIQQETDTTIDIREDGTVYILATSAENARAARDRIKWLTAEPEVGEIYTGRVVRTTDFGAFVEILPGTDGMVHISQLDTTRVNRVEDVVKVGDEITVMVTDIDPDGKIRLSRQAVLEGWTPEEARSRDRRGPAPSQKTSSSTRSTSSRPAGGAGKQPQRGKSKR
ncbi:MAG: polyribonucleotide nucleotidyltransferase [Anaerolineales bacterium]